ncbi:MAG TPA: PadR family transcriptional regulator [Opitutaceae bacterium]|nr:PadR family transcriptional regulator [Opitutaceae bacterium]
MANRRDIPLYGTLDMLILGLLAEEELHGFGIAQKIHALSKEELSVGEGSLYPALHRLEFKKWISSSWKQSETGRKARFYMITAAGRRQLRESEEDWSRLAAAVGRVLRGAAVRS